MGFDVARGLSLPMLVLHGAHRDRDRVRAELARARAWTATGDEIYCHKRMLDLVLTLQGLSGQMSRGDVERWRTWHRKNEATATDAVRDTDDRLPAVVDTAQWVHYFIRYPRTFVRSFVLNR
jgi:hypothetical protein